MVRIERKRFGGCTRQEGLGRGRKGGKGCKRKGGKEEGTGRGRDAGRKGLKERRKRKQGRDGIGREERREVKTG